MTDDQQVKQAYPLADKIKQLDELLSASLEKVSLKRLLDDQEAYKAYCSQTELQQQVDELFDSYSADQDVEFGQRFLSLASQVANWNPDDMQDLYHDLTKVLVPLELTALQKSNRLPGMDFEEFSKLFKIPEVVLSVLPAIDILSEIVDAAEKDSSLISDLSPLFWAQVDYARFDRATTKMLYLRVGELSGLND